MFKRSCSYKKEGSTRVCRHFFLSFILVCLMGFFSILNASPAIISYQDIVHPIIAENGMVASQEVLATEVGLTILKQGGNAVDAAVAMGFAMAVTLPRAGNLGGGGFMLIYDAKAQKTVALDYREVAPLRAHKDLFLDENGNVDSALSRDSALSVGVPGTVAGLIYALENYGTFALSRVLKPAIELAQKGFLVSDDLHHSLLRAKNKMALYPETMSIFFKKDGNPYQVGERLIQKDLAKTLRYISKKGTKGFYEGEIAKKIEAYMKTHNGLISREDLKMYTPVLRQPIEGNYRGFKVYSMPPPSSGGIHLVQMLNVLEGFNLEKMGHNSAQSIHLLTEVMKRAYADRSKYLGDPDFASLPIDQLTSKTYAKIIRDELSLDKATPSSKIEPGHMDIPYESNETTHFSVMDEKGNIVSNTYTLNFSYGNKRVVPGTGILLNNEMDDFSSKPGVPNAYGLIGGELNAIGPKKRMLSSMTPTIVLSSEKSSENGFQPFLVTGSPGGSRIITTVLQIVLNVIDYKMSIAEATVAPRIHHQWYPDEIRIEKGLSIDTLKILKSMGHKIERKWAMGSTQSIMYKDGHYYGFSDPRKPGALTKGY